MNKELLKKYFSNCCTEKELISVLEWFEKSAASLEGKSFVLKVFDEMPNEAINTKVNFDLLLNKIHHQVNLTQSTKLLHIADQNIIKYKRRENFKKIIIRIAAILLIPVLCFGLYVSNKYQIASQGQISLNLAYNEVLSSVDAITKVTLPDGSVVWLNHGSSLRYPAMFHGNLRNVELNGEGYFEVAHNSKIPFIVKTGEIQVKAVGTTFNVMAYADDDKIEISLINGQVVLEEGGKNGKTLLQMKPTDLAIFQKRNNEISTLTINDDRYFSWKEGKLIFNKEPMDEVAKKLSRWFNTEIQISDPELNELTYTATFINETLPQVMDLIARVSPISYTISNRKEISSGTFTKRKVTISYKNK